MGQAIPGRIPWTAVLAWAEFHGYGPEETMMLDACIGAMDAEFIEHWRARQAPTR